LANSDAPGMAVPGVRETFPLARMTQAVPITCRLCCIYPAAHTSFISLPQLRIHVLRWPHRSPE
jgi:hypothetical protein